MAELGWVWNDDSIFLREVECSTWVTGPWSCPHNCRLPPEYTNTHAHPLPPQWSHVSTTVLLILPLSIPPLMDLCFNYHSADWGLNKISYEGHSHYSLVTDIGYWWVLHWSSFFQKMNRLLSSLCQPRNEKSRVGLHHRVFLEKKTPLRSCSSQLVKSCIYCEIQ